MHNVSRIVRHGLLMAGALAIATGSAMAHHSYVMFNRTKLVQVEATIARLEWKNPHVWIWAYVPNGKGGHDLYGFESGSVNSLARRGWTVESLKVGEKTTIYMFPLANGDKGGYFVQATRQNGSTLIGDEAAYMQLPGEKAPPPQPPKD